MQAPARQALCSSRLRCLPGSHKSSKYEANTRHAPSALSPYLAVDLTSCWGAFRVQSFPRCRRCAAALGSGAGGSGVVQPLPSMTACYWHWHGAVVVIASAVAYLHWQKSGCTGAQGAIVSISDVLPVMTLPRFSITRSLRCQHPGHVRTDSFGSSAASVGKGSKGSPKGPKDLGFSVKPPPRFILTIRILGIVEWFDPSPTSLLGCCSSLPGRRKPKRIHNPGQPSQAVANYAE